jgi:hypothetical protein
LKKGHFYRGEREKMLLDTFIKRGKEFLGCDMPIMCGAMTWVSDCTLIGAVGNAGGSLMAGQSVGFISKSNL